MGPVDPSGDMLTERLLGWYEQARLNGKTCRAEYLLLLAWRAYDRPAKRAERAI